MVLQALLRNPLATPFTLGVSAGAALGAMLAITFPLPLAFAGLSAVPRRQLRRLARRGRHRLRAGAVRRRGLSTSVLLLAGVTLNAFFSALILFVQYLADFSADVPDGALADGRPRRRPATGRSWRRCRCRRGVRGVRLAAARAQPADARRRTRPRRAAWTSLRAQRLAFFSASLATGAAVSLGGPIGFIGIVVPHLVRLLVGSDHRLVLPASALFGAGVPRGVRRASRTILAPMELPVGIVTAIIGGPFFLWLLLRAALTLGAASAGVRRRGTRRNGRASGGPHCGG